MLAVENTPYQKYGCPNCGCDSSIRDNFFRGDQQAGTCRACGLHFMIIFDGATQKDIIVKYGTVQKDENGQIIMEYPILIPHPRKGIDKWKYELPDIRPDQEDAEFFQSRGVGYDLAGYIKSKAAGERIMDMIKEILGTDKSKSFLDYRDYEPFRIQFKFKKEEFNLNMLHSLVIENDNIITKDILIQCKI